MNIKDALEKKLKHKITIVNARYIKPIDSNILDALSESHKTIFTLEEGSLIGGFGSSVLQYFANKNIDIQVYNKGIEDSFIEHGTRDQLMSIAGLDEESLINYIEGKVLNEK